MTQRKQFVNFPPDWAYSVMSTYTPPLPTGVPHPAPTPPQQRRRQASSFTKVNFPFHYLERKVDKKVKSKIDIAERE
jgi:hypothetical protein